MAFSDPNLSILIEQLSQRLQAVENQVAILSQRMGVPSNSGFSAPPSGGVSFDPATGTVSFVDPVPGETAMGVPADPRTAGVPPEVVALARNKQKIQAIKLYRELTRCDLATAKKVDDGL